ncbi:MAG TPA: HlyD family efflux transporter periplasmic adaptor subunit, partial [Bacillota bacterium]
MIQRVVSLVVVLTILLGGGVYAYRQLAPAPADETEAPQYATAEVRRGDIEVGVTATGTLNPMQGGAIQVPWPMGPIYGPIPQRFTITEILAHEGDLVRMGQPLVRLASGELESQISNLERDLRQKRENLAAKLGVDAAELDVINPARGITLRAPIAGRVTGLTVKEGDKLEQGTAVASIVNDAEWSMTLTLTPAEFRRLGPDQRVAVRFVDFAGLLEARIVEANPNPMPRSTKDLLDCRGTAAGGEGEGGTPQLVYRVTVQGQNPGLIVAGMVAEVGLPPADAPIGAQPQQWADRISWFRYCGKVDGYGREERVLSTAEGIVTELFVHDMELVEAGDPILSLSGDETQRSIEQDLEAIRNLEMQVSSLRDFARQLTVTAPIDGIVAELRVQPGQEIQMGEPMGHIYNPQQMEMWVQVDDVDVLRVRQDAPVEIRLDALPGQTLNGRVAHIAVSGEGQGGITFFQVRIEVEGNDQLRPGMQAEAYIKSGEARGVLLVPLEALFQEDRQYKVEILED